MSHFFLLFSGQYLKVHLRKYLLEYVVPMILALEIQLWSYLETSTSGVLSGRMLGLEEEVVEVAVGVELRRLKEVVGNSQDLLVCRLDEGQSFAPGHLELLRLRRC